MKRKPFSANMKPRLGMVLLAMAKQGIGKPSSALLWCLDRQGLLSPSVRTSMRHSDTIAGRPGNCWSRTRASCTQSLFFVASTRCAVWGTVSRHGPGTDKLNAWLQAGFEDDEGQFQQGVFNDFVEPFIQDARKHRCSAQTTANR